MILLPILRLLLCVDLWLLCVLPYIDLRLLCVDLRLLCIHLCVNAVPPEVNGATSISPIEILSHGVLARTARADFGFGCEGTCVKRREMAGRRRFRHSIDILWRACLLLGGAYSGLIKMYVI